MTNYYIKKKNIPLPKDKMTKNIKLKNFLRIFRNYVE